MVPTKRNKLMSFFDDSSLAFLPSGAAGKDGKAYSIKPTDGTGDFTFSRGSNLAATRVGPTGLIEKGRENLLLQSNNFTTTWTLGAGLTLTSGQTGYDGSSDAWLYADTATGNSLQQNKSASGVQTLSIYAKAGTADGIRLRWLGGSGGDAYFNIADASTEAYQSTNTIATKKEDIGSGWFRVSLTFNDSVNTIRVYVADGSTTSSVSGNIVMQDAQLEIGLAATDYIESGATTGKAGLLEDEPRFDYSGGATCPSLLLEPSRTNKLPYSEYFGAWTIQSGITLTPNTDETLSPEGLNNAYKIVSTIGTTGFYFAGLNSSVESVRSIYLKGSAGGETLALKDPSGNGSFTSVTLTTEWQRFTHSTSNTGQNYQGLQIDDISVGTIYAYGAQWEEASYPTSYIPNHSGGTITRGSDDFKVINQEGLFGTNEGTFFMEFSFNENNKYIGIGDTWPSDKVTIGLNSSGTNQIRSLIKNNGVNINLQGIGTTLGDTIKACVSYGSSGFKLFMNGSLEDSDATAANLSQFSDLIPNVDVRDVSNSNSGSIKQILIFPTTLSDADCITLTTI